MTEQVAEQVAQSAEPTFADPVQKAMYEQFIDLIKSRNALVGKVNAANGDAVALKEQITEESTDADIVAAREARDNAIEALEALVKPQVEAMINNAAEGLADAEASIKDIDSKLKPGLTFYKKLYGDDAVDALPTQTRLKGMRIGNSGSSGRRIRGFNVTVTIDNEIQEFESFAAAANYLDEDTKSLQDAFFAAAGTDVLKEVANKVFFNVTFTEVDDDGNKTEREAAVLAYRTDPSDDVEDKANAPAPQNEGPGPTVPENNVVDEDDLQF